MKNFNRQNYKLSKIVYVTHVDKWANRESFFFTKPQTSSHNFISQLICPNASHTRAHGIYEADSEPCMSTINAALFICVFSCICFCLVGWTIERIRAVSRAAFTARSDGKYLGIHYQKNVIY